MAGGIGTLNLFLQPLNLTISGLVTKLGFGNYLIKTTFSTKIGKIWASGASKQVALLSQRGRAMLRVSS